MTETKMELSDWLDDLCVRFIINLPKEDLSSVARICFQVEEAQWYYEDFIRPLDPNLPSMSLRTFCMQIFQHCPLLSNFSATDHMGAFEEFLLYKTRVPVRGAIMLNEVMDSVLLVKGWKKGANWSFPRGKINKDEDDLDCAIREVYEETGYDIKAAGLVPQSEQVKYIEMEMREQHMRLYVFRSVPMDTHFEPRTRKEISKIEWWKLSDLPAFRKKNKPNPEGGTHVAVSANKFYMVAPFLRPLKTWVVEQKKKDAKRTASGQYFTPIIDDTLTEEEPTIQGDLDVSYDEGPSSIQHLPAVIGASADADTMAKTTEALKRLLKILPATEGIQSQLSSPLDKSKSNKGADLLALLRGKPEGLEAPKSTMLPRTPFEQITFDPVKVPRTPHHQHPPPPDLSSMPPPPSFPIPPTGYNGQQGKMPPHQPQNAGISGTYHPVHPQFHMQETRNHLQQLRHPQPLPPQVQRTLFTGGLAHSPAVPQFQTQEFAPNHKERASFAVSNPQFPNIHGPMVPEPKLRPQLTEHSLSLLNVFKTRDKETPLTALGPSRDLPLRTYSQDTIKPIDVKAPPLAVPGNGSGALSPPSGNNFAAPTMLFGRAPPTEEHKSSLLNIFKQPIRQPVNQPAMTTTAPSVTNPGFGIQANNVFQATPSPVSHAHPTKSISNPLNQQFSNRTLENYGLQGSSRTTPGPVLSRSSNPATTGTTPFQAQAEPMNSSPRQRIHRSNGHHSNNNNSVRSARNIHPVAEKAFQPQILKRPQQSPGSQHSVLPEFLQRPSPSSLEASKPLVSSKVDHRRPSQSTEHLQSLLALLPKKPGANAPPQFGTPRVSIPSTEQTKASLPRPIIGDLGDIGSRRGSQTPLSPANQGFLLDYLAGAAKSAKTQGR